MITEMQTNVEQHYTIPNLPNVILETLKKVKNNPEKYTPEDLKTFDEFHLQGLQATLDLAGKISLQPDMSVLDLGSGLGGPARTLASKYNCMVSGIELVAEYYKSAQMLSELVNLNKSTKFYHGSALDLPFADRSFDVVWTQHMTMNIQDKKKLFSEAYRVLKPNGKLAIYEIIAGEAFGGNFFYPVPWAGSPAINFLSKTNEFIATITSSGFKQISVQNVTEKCANWIANVKKAAASNDPNPLGLNLIAGSDFGLKVGNILENIQVKNLEVVEAIFEKPE